MMAPTTQPGITKKAMKLMTSETPLSDSCDPIVSLQPVHHKAVSSLKTRLAGGNRPCQLDPTATVIKFNRPYRAVGVPASAVRLDTSALPAPFGRADAYQRASWGGGARPGKTKGKARRLHGIASLPDFRARAIATETTTLKLWTKGAINPDHFRASGSQYRHVGSTVRIPSPVK